jgi:hypothetical protein
MPYYLTAHSGGSQMLHRMLAVMDEDTLTPVRAVSCNAGFVLLFVCGTGSSGDLYAPPSYMQHRGIGCTSLSGLCRASTGRHLLPH